MYMPDLLAGGCFGENKDGVVLHKARTIKWERFFSFIREGLRRAVKSLRSTLDRASKFGR